MTKGSLQIRWPDEGVRALELRKDTVSGFWGILGVLGGVLGVIGVVGGLGFWGFRGLGFRF